jgi:hypothetical protein
MTLQQTLTSLNNQLMENKQLAADAHLWAALDWEQISMPNVNPFSQQHKDLITQVAFFQTFLNWERFLEESFIAYLLGECPPNGIPPICWANPPDRTTAEKMVADGRHTDWTAVDAVVNRAVRFFDAGKPYSDALTPKRSILDEIKTIRNTIAHSSQTSREKFEKLVRRELGSLPSGLTVGGYLDMTIPSTSIKARNVNSPASYLEFYVDTLIWLAEEIIPV